MAYIEGRLVHDADAHIMETSSWLRDYLYFPLGGNRRSEAVTYRKLVERVHDGFLAIRVPLPARLPSGRH